MHNAMLGLFNLGGGEIIIILFVLMFLGTGVVAAVLIAVWLLAKQRQTPGPMPPVQPTSPGPSAPSQTCPKCGLALSAGAPEGLCPRCVMGVGLAPPTDPGEFGLHGTRVLQPPLAPAEIAKHFPQLEILECLGRGGMGVVYKARQPKLNREVALKILAPEKGADPKFAERFLREAQSLARLNHPNIVTVHDFGEADGLYYLLMEYVDGVTLRQLLQTRKMAPEEALKIVPKICEALQFAHEQGIVHRDIKPENVLLDKHGRVKIADFGIAKLVGVSGPHPALTEEQSMIGTPHYMAPEQVEKPQLVDHRADIYSLGVVFYEMLTGELPLGKFEPPSRKVQIDVRLDEVVLHALEKEPERRYQQASEVKTDLETIAATAGAAPTSAKAAPPVRILRWRDAWPWDNGYIQLFVLVPLIVVALAIPLCMHWWGLKALWLFAIELPAFGFAIVYGVVGYRVRRKKAALARPTGEVAECLMFRRPFQAPGLAVMHEDCLELIPIVGSPITVVLADIVAVREVRWFNGTRLWWKKGFVMELANGQRVGVAVAEVFARRWRARLSRGSLPEID
jgi:tRNA A-37 threonylcarbamoyl transferase component Bud32